MPSAYPSPGLRFNISLPQEPQMVAEDVPVEEVQPWKREPSTLQELLDTYNVENKLTAHVPGGMLYLTKAETRSGEMIDVVPDQKHKLFLVPW